MVIDLASMELLSQANRVFKGGVAVLGSIGREVDGGAVGGGAASGDGPLVTGTNGGPPWTIATMTTAATVTICSATLRQWRIGNVIIIAVLRAAVWGRYKECSNAPNEVNGDAFAMWGHDNHGRMVGDNVTSMGHHSLVDSMSSARRK